jgi:hypothetical protein
MRIAQAAILKKKLKLKTLKRAVAVESQTQAYPMGPLSSGSYLAGRSL